MCCRLAPVGVVMVGVVVVVVDELDVIGEMSSSVVFYVVST